MAVVFLKPLLIGPALDVFNPLGVNQIPLNRFANSGLEGFFWRPAQFALDLAGVDSVAQIVAGAVLDVGDELSVRADRGQARSYS